MKASQRDCGRTPGPECGGGGGGEECRGYSGWMKDDFTYRHRHRRHRHRRHRHRPMGT